MDRRTYVLSTHPGCIEANYVERRGSEINLLTRLDSQFFFLKEVAVTLRPQSLRSLTKT